MAIRQHSEATSIDWTATFAERTRADVGEGLAAILALANATDLISFSGGFPDPATFPGPLVAEIMAELVASDDSSAMQYGPTRGLPGPRSFVSDLSQRSDAVVIVQAITDLARNLNMKTTAEGVENEVQRDIVREAGCTEMQGYLFTKPRPLAELRQLLMPLREAV